MKRQAPYRSRLLALGLALALLALSNPLMRYAQEKLKQEHTALVAEKADLAHSLQQLRDDAATAQRLSREMDTAGVESNLAPTDRLRIAAQFEPMAKAQRLSHFIYILSPEQPLKSDGGSGALCGIAQSTLTLEADAPHDGDAVGYIEHLQQTLPGRLQLKHLNLDLISSNDKAPGALNIRMSATLNWLANASRTIGGKCAEPEKK